MDANHRADELFKFIRNNKIKTAEQIALKQISLPGWEPRELANQIKSRQKAESKLPVWHQTKGIIFPDSIFLEQASSEATASFKASLFAGKKILDCTGGTGIDSYFFAEAGNCVTYIEREHSLCELAKHNYNCLNAQIEVLYLDCVHYLKTTDTVYDLVYIDPLRRTQRGRVFGFEESVPNVIEILPLIFLVSPKCLIKASPMMDIRQGIRDLRCVEEVFVISSGDEVKEILFLCSEAAQTRQKIFVADADKKEVQTIFFIDEPSDNIEVSPPERYLYDPSPGIRKAGFYSEIAGRFLLNKIHANTHLFTSNTFQKDFPGRIFEVLDCILPSKAALKKHFPEGKAWIVSRNFPDSVSAIRNRWKIKEGGEKFIFACETTEGYRWIICNRIFPGSIH